jgi:hypothetical protein
MLFIGIGPFVAAIADALDATTSLPGSSRHPSWSLGNFKAVIFLLFLRDGLQATHRGTRCRTPVQDMEAKAAEQGLAESNEVFWVSKLRGSVLSVWRIVSSGQQKQSLRFVVEKLI